MDARILRSDHATARVRKVLAATRGTVSLAELRERTGLSHTGALYAIEQLSRKGEIDLTITKKER